MIRRFGPPPMPRRYRLRHGAYAILVRDGAVLLTFQNHPAPEFQLPGGGIDPGESSQAALHREVREETGWTIGGARRLGAYRRHCFMPEYGFWAEKLCSIWLARPILRQGPPTEPGHSAHWVPLAEAAARLPDPGARAFMRALARRHGWKGFKGH
ncbi:NUDIX domain-containing protein [Paracoccus yeei]|uniref:NUDIX domain-containing protein n=1 Tax=Paracoccus yeei TaxID=147645 RepID=UPI003BF77309